MISSFTMPPHTTTAMNQLFSGTASRITRQFRDALPCYLSPKNNPLIKKRTDFLPNPVIYSQSSTLLPPQPLFDLLENIPIAVFFRNISAVPLRPRPPCISAFQRHH